MSELIILENNTPITTSRIIADGIGNKHKNVIELIQRHEERIKRFRGVLPFGTEKPKKGSKGVIQASNALGCKDILSDIILA
jgi:phage regulator Rha-like protein